MRTSLRSRAVATFVIVLTLVLLSVSAPAGAADAEEKTTCVNAALSRVRTEIDADLRVAQFDPSLGTLLGVTVNGPSLVLDTDAMFESTAMSAVQFAATMTYQVVVTSPGGLPSPPAITGTVTRVPSQTLAAFDGTLDYLGPSAVTQPSMTVSESAATVNATDGATLAAFTGSGTMPFHLTSTISETFMGGGGNVDFEINTFIAASVEVCYRYALAPPPESPPPVVPPDAPPVAVPPAPVPAQLALTGGATAPLAVAALALIGVGLALVRRSRALRPRLDA